MPEANQVAALGPSQKKKKKKHYISNKEKEN